MRLIGATTFTIATTVASRIAEILHDTVAARHFERCPTGTGATRNPEKRRGLGQVKTADRSI